MDSTKLKSLLYKHIPCRPLTEIIHKYLLCSECGQVWDLAYYGSLCKSCYNRGDCCQRCITLEQDVLICTDCDRQICGKCTATTECQTEEGVCLDCIVQNEHFLTCDNCESELVPYKDCFIPPGTCVVLDYSDHYPIWCPPCRNSYPSLYQKAVHYYLVIKGSF